jgi:NAD(P)-dependent dehydrogenase (short-subunit alcohol dehydrogenase family)
MQNNLENKTIFLTGACGGLGSALALELCKAKADVIISDKNPRSLNIMCDKIVEQGGKEPLVYPMDLVGATPNDFYQLSETIGKNIGKLDALVHTAAEFSGLTEFTHYEATRWLQEMQINLNSPIFLTQALLPLLKKNHGSIIFTTENLETVSKAYWGAYGTTKAGINHFSSVLKEEMEDFKVSVNSLVPAPMKTQLRAKAWPAETDKDLVQPEIVVKQYTELLNMTIGR